MVAIYRCVGEGSNARWLTRARLRHGEVLANADLL
jgi:hypothetical protein